MRPMNWHSAWNVIIGARNMMLVIVKPQTWDRCRDERVRVHICHLSFKTTPPTNSCLTAYLVFSAVNDLMLMLSMLTMCDCDGCANHFPLLELSVVKVVLDPIFKLLKAGLFGG